LLLYTDQQSILVKMDRFSMDDPSTWPVDQVVHEICHNEQPLWVARGLKDIPDKRQLEATLRSNHVSGAELVGLTLQELKDDLQIPSLGQRKALLRVIRFLRGEPQDSATPAPATIHERIRSYQTGMLSPTTFKPSNLSASPNWSLDDTITGMSSENMGQMAAPPPTSRPAQISKAHPTRPFVSLTTSTRPMQPSTMPYALASSVSESAHAHTHAQKSLLRNPIAPDVYPPPISNLDQADHGIGAGTLELLEAHIDQSLQKQAEGACKPDQPSLTQKGESTAVTRMKKRVAPTLIESRGQQFTSGLSAQRNFYLRSQPLPMQDTFYGGPFDDEREFQLSTDFINPGVARVVSRRLNHFFNENLIAAPGDGQDRRQFLARLPFSQRQCAGLLSKQYFTLFNSSETPQQQLLSSWPQLVTGMEHKPASQEEDVDLGDLAYLLKRYPPESGSPLPLYDESGSENEYDEELWDEYLAEQEERKATSKNLTDDQASAVVETCIHEIKSNWKKTKLQKIEAKAYRLWMKVAKARKRQPDIDAQHKFRAQKTAYLDKLKENILQDQWRSQEQLQRQCEILELTVDQICEADHLLAVLHSDVPPPVPAKSQSRRTRKERARNADGEESIGSDSDEPLDDLQGNFIVDDDGDVAMAADDPADLDFNPIMPHKPAIVLSTIEDPTVDAIAAEAETRVLTERTKTPETYATSTAADDADNETDEPQKTPKSSPTKRRRLLKKSAARPSLIQVKREAWSTSSQAPSPSDDEANSDFDSANRLPANQYKYQGMTKDEAIAIPSSDPISAGDKSRSTSFSVATPPLNPDNASESDPPIAATRTRRVGGSTLASAHIEKILGRGARMRILNTLLNRPDVDRPSLASLADFLFRRLPKQGDFLKDTITKGLRFMGSTPGSDEDNQQNDFSIAGIPAAHQKAAEILMHIFIWYVKGASQVSDLLDINLGFVNEAWERRDEFTSTFSKDFYSLTRNVDQKDSVTIEDSSNSCDMKRRGSKFIQRAKRKALHISSDDPTNDSDSMAMLSEDPETRNPHKKHKRKIQESQEVAATHDWDRERVEEQERRRQQLVSKMHLTGTEVASQPPVNAQEPIILLDKHIASRVKAHQFNGIQFLWREIVADRNHRGCLLAHTMGLGKTMQVVSLLVTIAQCIKSTNSAISSQIPHHLMEKKFLIVCPPALIENWYDEILMWTPPTDPDLLGTIFKIGGRSDTNKQAVETWSMTGGVLLISYSTLRSYLSPPAKNAEFVEQVADYEKWLLQSAGLVIADEAHQLKKASSKIAQVASRFTTGSRIALTGSPLNNHLEEYYTMVEWIAKNYLGSLPEFRQKYMDPINAGLYTDSTKWERRKCLQKLHVLQKDLSPKVSRADITAIEEDMPPKTEYIITIPLAAEQRKAYDIYVKALVSARAQQGASTNRNLFVWLYHLILLVNHPSCFMRVISDHTQTRTLHEVETSGDENHNEQSLQTLAETYEPLDTKNVSNVDLGAMQEAASGLEKLLDGRDARDPILSYRTSLTIKIVEKATAARDSTLIFSQSIPTLDYLEEILGRVHPNLMRIDGSVKTSTRQQMTKDFNNAADTSQAKVILISTKAGGLGLNLYGANRVIIFDYGFNPMWEEQAVGRAYRLGQKKPVFVYRFKCGGTFEDIIYNKALFKTQLFQRVVDKKNPTRAAGKAAAQYLFASKDIERNDFAEFRGRDSTVLDAVLGDVDYVYNLELTETFQKDDNERLNDEEYKEAEALYQDEQLRRNHPREWLAKQAAMTGLNAPMAMPRMGTQDGRGEAKGANGMAASTFNRRQDVQSASHSMFTNHAANYRSVMNSTGPGTPLAWQVPGAFDQAPHGSVGAIEVSDDSEDIENIGQPPRGKKENERSKPDACKTQ
jgi:SNF2 family DNA or RNA helicase